jgi:murein DD-endopeptidase MepM/ murein hydrolase activator NlpD
MANKMVSQIQSLSTGVSGLTSKINDLYAALEKVNGIAAVAITKTQGAINANGGGEKGLGTSSSRPGTGADKARFTQTQTRTQTSTGVMDNSLAPVSGRYRRDDRDGYYDPYRPTVSDRAGAWTYGKVTGKPTPQGEDSAGLGGLLTGPLKMMMAPLAGAYAGMPDFSATMQTAVGYYQAGLKTPGISRAFLERSTIAAMGRGESSVGAGGMTAALLAGRGYTPGSANYRQALGEVGGAYKYLGIDNAAAASSIAGMHTGSMGANLSQYGITTYNLKTGQDKTMGQISKELMDLMTGGKNVTAEQVQTSFQKGALGANLSTMGFDAAQQEMIRQAMIDLAEGRNPDLATRGAGQDKDKNSNRMLTSAGRANTAQSETMAKAETRMIQGFENAADAIEGFNRFLRKLPGFDLLAQGKGFISGVGGSNMGDAITTFTAVFSSGIKDLLGGITAILRLKPGGGGTSGYGASINNGGPGIGGGSSGYGAGYAVTAGYGAQDPKVWASTGGKHTGVDYQMKEGTPVKAWKDGVVSAVNIGADYGTSVVVDHANGYQSLYGHLSAKDVQVGDAVKEGGRIGKSGKSGKSNGPHLHFEVRHGKNNPVNPASVERSIKRGALGALYGQYASLRPTSEAVTGSAKTTTSSPTGDSASTSSGSTSSGSGAPMGSKDQQAWATTLLTKLGAPVTGTSLKALTAWMRAEGKGWSTSLNRATYNPLNTTLDMPGAVSFNKVGVKAYTSVDQGVEATLATLTGKSADSRGYTAIIESLKNGSSAKDILSAINNSAWRSGQTNDPGYKFPTGGGTSGYGASMPSTSYGTGNKTVNITLKIDKASEDEAIKFAKKVKKYLQDDMDIAMMGSR